MARTANRTVWATAMDIEDRNDAAWHGVVEALYEAEHWVPHYKLVAAGQRAIWRTLEDNARHHGRRPDRGAEPRGAFEAFWADWTRFHFPSHESRVVERTALYQVFVQLPPRQREALLALAAHDDYPSAARAADMSLSLLRVTLSNARRRFIELWLEGETPAKRREHYNRRPTSKPNGVKPCGTYPAYHRHRMHREVPCDPCKRAYREYRLMLKERAAS
jgi:DNA-directed RNA polymerase specialized sigma24 family protein